MPRLSELTEEELLQEVDEWLEHEDEESIAWINKGVTIYQRLAQKNRQEIQYRETLAKLLLKQGEDLKMRQHSYQKAIKSFEQVIRLDRDNPRAYYRLGFLYFYIEAWAKAVDAFQQSLASGASKQSNCLTKEQKIKAHHFLLKATQIILHEQMKEVEKLPDEELDLFTELRVLLHELKQGTDEQEKPYQMIVNGTELTNIAEWEYENLSDPWKNSECFILNQRSMNDTIVSLYEREERLTNNAVSLLEFLMRHPEGVPSDRIIRNRQAISNDPPGKLRQDIRRLRQKLRNLDPEFDFIVNIDGGYRWNWTEEYRMFKHNRDVTSEMLMD